MTDELSHETEPFRRTDLSVQERAADLLSRLTADERVAMLHQAMPAIERWGVAEARTGAETLHGVAWLGEATVFPQPVGLAATWDTELIEAVGSVTSTELRAKRAENPLVSLNVWAPVVNTLRHPLWGRNEEGYSEDPHLTGQFGAAYAKGLRGDDERVWKTVPALKHFLAYSNETDRSATSSEMSLRTLHEEELAAFRPAIEQQVAGSMMLAYNQVNGIPAHTQPELVAEARSWTDGSLAIVSDAGAPTFVVTVQGAQPDSVHAAAALVRSGMDSFTDNDADAQPTITNLNRALEQGLLTRGDIDRAVSHILEMRVRTGEFDGDADLYAGIGIDAIDAPGARELAREVAGRSVVVLRNDAGVLPLVAPARIAVVGPMAEVVLTDWYAGTPPYAVGIAQGLAERYPSARVETVTGADTITLRAADGRYVVSNSDGSKVAAVGDEAGDDALFDVTDWGDGLLTLRSHASGRLLTGGAWPMKTDAERVGGWVVQESFRRHLHADGSWSLLHLGSGRWVRASREVGLLLAEGVTLDDAEHFSVEIVRSGADAVAAAAASVDVVIVAVGNDPHLAGRETADRPHMLLPEAFTDLWRIAHEANERTVLQIVSSYPYVLAGAVAAATVVWSSHGGQELGHGIADVLSGDREPTGRLAQSWPADPTQAGDLFDYDTQRQQATYRHQPAPYAFAFGHGLTYSTVEYRGVTLVADQVDAPAPTHRHPALGVVGESAVTAVVTVANTGERVAEELVQLYSIAPELPITAPRRLLVGYRRVRLEPGEQQQVEITFDVARLSVWDGALRLDGAAEDWLHEGALRVQPGSYRVAAGPSADDLPVLAELTVS
ncbi:glycoside hydrolase family 3 C-terminal domain-containing protein [Microbacterium murale]|uniref:Beta-glucosidase n=1 Tax=Microbacterium murale TaxID=1081040 RepID=A0ABU0PB98_9MICO|nr:glycoside hydrolase family 3 C-terminal domain-containing protein [Microbacterium murale]MDQ0644628.1 beta-glucosidase [Microbacterium murale]